MTHPPGGSWQQRDLNAAIERVTGQYRRELDQLHELLVQRMDSMDTARQMYLGMLAERKQTFEIQVADLGQRLDERYTAQTLALNTAFGTAEKAVAAALASAEKAVTKAETATEARFAGVNEFRQALTDQAGTFLPRAQYDAAHQALVEVTSELRSRMDALGGTIVSRAENDTWRDALLDKINANADRISALELRLTSRLDLNAGGDVRETAGRERLNQTVVMLIMAVSVVVAIASIVAFALKK